MRILLDVDGVLADFSSGYLAIANRLAGTNHQHADVRHWDLDKLPGLAGLSTEIWREVGRPGFAQLLKPYAGAQEGVKELAKLGEVWVVTSPLWMHEETREPLHGQTFCYDRVCWLEEHFGIPRKQVYFAYHKHLVKGELLVDDKLENIEAWARENSDRPGKTKAVLWAQAYNEGSFHPMSGILRTDSWERVAQLAASLRQ